MSSRQDRLIHWLLGSLDLQTTLFHLGQYCGSWKASTTGLARAGFHVILHGDCWLHLPEARVQHALRAGDAVFFLRDQPHFLSPHEDRLQAEQAPRCPMDEIDLSAPGSTALACGFFDFRAPLNNVFLGSFPDYVVISRDGETLRETRPIFELILSEARVGGEAPSPLIARLVDLLFFYVIRHLCQRHEVSSGLWAVLARPEFTPLLEAIVDQPGHDWSIEAMADLSHMSRATFCKRFTQIAGTSPSHFLTQIRMKLATQLIEEGMSLARAAEQVGYQSDAAFSRAFKKTTGTLPGALRRSAIGPQKLAA
jgi:AraC-like DNA-binding protein